MLTSRWYELRYHRERQRLWNSRKRFRVVPAGRRSGKTEYAKRFIVREALRFNRFYDGRFACLAPTRDQAKRIFWDDLKALVPKPSQTKVSESELSIKLENGALLQVLGMDKPERVEGPPLDGAVCDEYGNMKPEVWSRHLSGALATIDRPGWAWFIGVPEGRNHYYRLYQEALKPDRPAWDAFHWVSSDILDPDEIEDAKTRMDPLSYDQEFNASFLNFTGRAYYAFDQTKHAVERLKYNPDLPLIFCFDFNRAPGVAIVLQEQEYGGPNPWVSENFTAAIGEVFIPQNSTTPAVCRKLVHDWDKHKGKIYCYGDSTGGAKGSAKVKGSDWDLIKAELRMEFAERVKFRVPKRNPLQRSRVNSVNSRLVTADGYIHFLIDPKNCKHLIEDLDGVIVLEGGAGEIDKDHDEMLTHMSDAIGYYFAEKYNVYKERTMITIDY